MQFRPLNEEEIDEINHEIANLEKDIEVRQRGVANLKKMIRDGAWVSEFSYASDHTSDTIYIDPFGENIETLKL